MMEREETDRMYDGDWRDESDREEKAVEQREPKVSPTGYVGTDVAAVVFRFQLTQCRRIGTPKVHRIQPASYANLRSSSSLKSKNLRFAVVAPVSELGIPMVTR
ncbi:hypothetical protein HanOQP8_Chr03g0118691 [Helianthus annuus]|nr:hypothetical protein HanOQP8_Chr03g0118691 [Helianthus annuus]